MHRAAGMSSKDIAELLIRSGANVNAKDQVSTTLIGVCVLLLPPLHAIILKAKNLLFL